MNITQNTPSDIYQRINTELDYIVKSLNTKTSDDSLNRAQDDAHRILTHYQAELQAQMTKLGKNSEWNTFTIAFYGETGAGKSTIIETLRILLQERSKLESQQAFRELRNRYALNEAKLQQLQQIIEQANARLDELARQLDATLQHYEKQYLAAQESIEQTDAWLGELMRQLDTTLQHYKQPYLTAQNSIEQTNAQLGALAQQLDTTLQHYEQSYLATKAATAQADHHHGERIQRLRTVLQQYKQQHDDALATITQLQVRIAERKRTASLWLKFLNLFRKSSEEGKLGLAQDTLATATAAHENASLVLHQKQAEARQEKLALENKLSEIASARDNACLMLREKQAQAEQDKLILEQKLSEIATARDNACLILREKQTEAEQKKLVLEQELSEIAAARDNASAALCEQQADIEKKKLVLIQQHQSIDSQMKELLAELAKRADGEIIGDGRADYTQKTHRYDFELEGQPFALLDVPGIEGNEGSIHSQIEQAVQTAHAVFYVTNKAAPPQTGDEQSKGTLEKIKEHLGAQTEVWTIFNKKITNPKHSLTNRPLISDDENASLNGLNEKMREQLGKHYRAVFPLTALPAFLASTDHFVPGSKNDNNRKKVLESFTADDLLEKSRLRAFLQLLGGQLIQDGKPKIIRANFNKAKEALDQASATLAGLQQNFTELWEKLNEDGEGAKIQLNNSFNLLKHRLEGSGKELIDNFESSVRNQMYVTIQNDIDNDVFKEKLKDTISAQHKNLSQKLPGVMEGEITRFQQDVKYILERSEEHARELSDIYAKINKTQLHVSFDLRLNLENGIKIGSLLATAVGTIAALLGTGGWVLAIGLIGLVFSFVKSVWGFFDSDFKKSEQRKATESNLRKITEQLRESLHDSLEKDLPKIEQTISQLELVLEAPAKQTSALVQSLVRSNEQLENLSRQIYKEGNL